MLKMVGSPKPSPKPKSIRMNIKIKSEADSAAAGVSNVDSDHNKTEKVNTLFPPYFEVK